MGQEVLRLGELAEPIGDVPAGLLQGGTDRLSFRLIQPRSRPFRRDPERLRAGSQLPMNPGERRRTKPSAPPPSWKACWSTGLEESDGRKRRARARSVVEHVLMKNDLLALLSPRLDEEAELARRCEGTAAAGS